MLLSSQSRVTSSFALLLRIFCMDAPLPISSFFVQYAGISEQHQVHIQGPGQVIIRHYRSRRGLHRHHQAMEITTMFDGYRSCLEMLHPQHAFSHSCGGRYVPFTCLHTLLLTIQMNYISSPPFCPIYGWHPDFIKTTGQKIIYMQWLTQFSVKEPRFHHLRQSFILLLFRLPSDNCR